MNEIFRDEHLLEHRREFFEIMRTVERSGVEELLDYLDKSDFFEGPATSIGHGNFTGGLCYHSILTYKVLCNLYETFKGEVDMISEIPQESLIVAGLLHDISKANTYVKDVKNKKFYSEAGSKKDQMGRYDWISEPYFAKRDDRPIYCSDEVTSEFLVHSFIPLNYEESVAILHSSGGEAYDSAQDNVAEIFSKHPLALLLHEADMIASYIMENKNSLSIRFGEENVE